MASKPGKNSSSFFRSKSSKSGGGVKPQSDVASTTRAATPALRSGAPASAPIAAINKPVTKVEAKPGVNLSATTGVGNRPTREAVAEAAYFLWLQRGGSDVANWLEAESMLRSKAKAFA